MLITNPISDFVRYGFLFMIFSRQINYWLGSWHIDRSITYSRLPI